VLIHRRALGAAALLVALGASTAAQALDQVTLRLNWQILGFHTAFYYGVEQGFYRDEGIDLVISEGRGGGVTAQAIGAKSDMVGIVDAGTTIVSAARGIPIQTVMSLMNRGIFAVVARADAGITTAKDLEGRTIAVTAGDALSQLFPAVIRRNGLDEGKIRLVNVDPAGKVVAVLERRADALLGSIDAQNFQLEARGVPAASLTFDEMGVKLVGLTVVAHEDTIREKPELLRRFARATQKAMTAAAADPDAAVAAGRKVKPELDPEVGKGQLLVSLDRFPSPATEGKPIGWGAESDWQATLELLTEFQGIKTDRPAASFFTNRFVE
jgi:NitT/TauT family transport system substrate-binding protein